jgi:hypothetical protein
MWCIPFLRSRKYVYRSKEVGQEKWRLYKEELQNLHTFLALSTLGEWNGGACKPHEKKRTQYILFVGKSEEKITLERPRSK